MLYALRTLPLLVLPPAMPSVADTTLFRPAMISSNFFCGTRCSKSRFVRILRCFLPAALALTTGGVDMTDELGVRAGKVVGVRRPSD